MLWFLAHALIIEEKIYVVKFINMYGSITEIPGSNPLVMSIVHKKWNGNYELYTIEAPEMLEMALSLHIKRCILLV